MWMNSPYLESVFRFEPELGQDQRKASGLGLRERGDFIAIRCKWNRGFSPLSSRPVCISQIVLELHSFFARLLPPHFSSKNIYFYLSSLVFLSCVILFRILL